MHLITETDHVDDFLEATEIVDFYHPTIAARVAKIQDLANTLENQAAIAFEYTRDQVRHSFDADDLIVTITAPDVVSAGTGICFAKSHLLAALFRGLGIPTGFCYQRVMRRGTVESGFALHGLNAAYFPEFGWVRLDPRGNRPGIQSEFNLYQEHLAYPIHVDAGESDYPYVYRHPLPSVLASLYSSKNCRELFFQRPEILETPTWARHHQNPGEPAMTRPVDHQPDYPPTSKRAESFLLHGPFDL